MSPRGLQQTFNSIKIKASVTLPKNKKLNLKGARANSCPGWGKVADVLFHVIK